MRGSQRRVGVTLTKVRGASNRVASFAAALVAFSFVAGSASAFAATGHAYSAQFGSSGSAPGQFSGPAGVAVEQSTGDVYAVDQFNNRVEKFDAGGGFLLTFNGSATPAGSATARPPRRSAVASV